LADFARLSRFERMLCKHALVPVRIARFSSCERFMEV
jgi:hypothetical protein